jgi:hypothetical protein
MITLCTCKTTPPILSLIALGVASLNESGMLIFPMYGFSFSSRSLLVSVRWTPCDNELFRNHALLSAIIARIFILLTPHPNSHPGSGFEIRLSDSQKQPLSLSLSQYSIAPPPTRFPLSIVHPARASSSGGLVSPLLFSAYNTLRNLWRFTFTLSASSIHCLTDSVWRQLRIFSTSVTDSLRAYSTPISISYLPPSPCPV